MEGIEMVKCPKCGRPFPKARKDLGYNCCVNCSTERPLVGLIEGIGPEGDSMDSISIMRPDIAFKVEKARRGVSRSICITPDEDAPDVRAIEDQEDMSVFDRDTRLAGMEEVEYVAPSTDEEKELGSVLDDLSEDVGQCVEDPKIEDGEEDVEEA